MVFCIDSMDTADWRALKLTTIISAIVATITAIIYHVILEEGVWANYESSSCTFCENNHVCNPENLAVRPPVHQPVNSWTNLAYFIVGLWPLMHRISLDRIIFCVACTYLFIGSFGFHASSTTIWSRLDVAAMYTLLLTVGCHGVHALTGLSWWFMIPGLIVFAVILPAYVFPNGLLIMGPSEMMTIFLCILIGLTVPLVVARIYVICQQQQDEEEPSSPVSQKKSVLTIGIEDCVVDTTTTNNNHASLHLPPSTTTRKAVVPKKWMQIVSVLAVAIFPAVLFGIAYFIWRKDTTKEWCNPTSALQGHGVWHVMTAFAAYFPWKFFDDNKYLMTEIWLGRSTRRRSSSESSSNATTATTEPKEVETENTYNNDTTVEKENTLVWTTLTNGLLLPDDENDSNALSRKEEDDNDMIA